MRSILDNDTYQEVISRIEKLTDSTHAQWGKMDVAQMLRHCSEIQEVINGKALENTPFIVKLLKKTIKNAVVNEKPYKRNSATHPQYKISSPQEFQSNKDRFIKSLEVFKGYSKEEHDKAQHPLFGPMGVEVKGWAMYKHVDHHLNQFGV